MKAIITKKYGSPDVLEIQEIKKPTINSNEILVKIYASSINPIDCKVRNGNEVILTGVKPPKVLGADYAGVVEEIGGKFTAFKIGDKVWGKVNSFKGGTYAEYIKVGNNDIDFMPNNVSFEEAASIPNVGLTALQSLKNHAKMNENDSVFINGVSGGVGLSALQISKSIGCTVTGVCSTINIKKVNALGLDYSIDYTQEKVINSTEKYDVIIDTIGNFSISEIQGLLNSKGRYISTVPSFASMFLGPLLSVFSPKKIKLMMVKPSSNDLQELRKLVESDELKPIVEMIYSFENIKEAHLRSETKRVFGKLVLNIC